ncbi:MAG: phage holin family protein [Fermentimonas sp.]|jgi:ABC-type bacteriocin/lantibiotic exporter with double-glycine peptidase domain
MEEKKVSTWFEEIRGDIANYITSTLELGKLEAYEKISQASSIISYSLILSGVALVIFLFVLIAAALYLGELLQSSWMGFAIVAAFALLILLILLIVKKPFKKRCINKVVRFLMHKEDKNDKNK